MLLILLTCKTCMNWHSDPPTSREDGKGMRGVVTIWKRSWMSCIRFEMNTIYWLVQYGRFCGSCFSRVEMPAWGLSVRTDKEMGNMSVTSSFRKYSCKETRKIQGQKDQVANSSSHLRMRKSPAPDIPLPPSSPLAVTKSNSIATCHLPLRGMWGSLKENTPQCQ